MKLFFTSVTLLSAALVSAQVDVDKPINLTGADGDRKITNLELPVDGTDAANKDYVDSSASASGGGCSAKPEAISDEAPSTMVFKNAVQYCENLDEDGHSDWRLPTLQEAAYFTGSVDNDNFFWTLSESPGMDFATNQNYISFRLSDGKWRNGGTTKFFFPSRSVSVSGFSNSTWTTVGSFQPLISGNAFIPTSISFSGGSATCSSPINYYRIVYNVDGGPSIVSPTYQASCSATSFNVTSIPLTEAITPYSSVDVQHYNTGATTGSFSLTISGYETNFSQRDGNPLHVRCVR